MSTEVRNARTAYGSDSTVTTETRMLKKANIGTVIHGTLRTGDLLDALAAELNGLVALNETRDLSVDDRGIVDMARDLAAEVQHIGLDSESEDAQDLLEAIIDQLQYFSPAGCYFGTLYGDGSDFGFWEHDEQTGLDETYDDDDCDCCDREEDTDEY